MSQVAERHESYVSGFEAFRRDAAFGDASWHEAREAAFRRFIDRGFPTTRDEEWRFTNVNVIANLPFERAAPIELSRADVEPMLFAHAIAARVVVVNGRVSPTLSSLSALPQGVTVRSARETHQSLAGTLAPTPFVDLNTAFCEDGTVIDVAPKTVALEPVHVLFINVSGEAPVMTSPRLIVRAGEQSQVSIVEHYAGWGSGTSLTNAVTEIRVGPGATVAHVKLQREPDTSFHLASLFAHIGRAGTFTSQSLTLGGRLTRNDIVATMEGEGAECTLNGLYVADGDCLVDNHTTIDHAQPHCPSHEVYRGILAGHARAVFNGKIIVRPDAQKTDAKQTNKALLLTDDAQINTKPQLEIFADDVRCTHGAAIGQLDEDALFYLRARGITAVDARNMLVHAFAKDILDRVAVADIRDFAEQLIVEKISPVR